MIRRVLIFASVAIALNGALARAQFNDVVRTIDGHTRATVESSTKDKIICQVDTGTKEIAVNVIEGIDFNGEPASMREARSKAARGDYADAVKLIADLRPDDLDRDILRVELEYRKLLYNARLVLNGGGSDDDSPQNLNEQATQAGRDMLTFLSKHGGTWHYYEANEVLGDLLVSVGKFETAATFYQKLTDAPWPEYKARAYLLQGRAMQSADKFDAAMQAYDAVLKAGASGKMADQQNVEAKIGRTYSMAGAGKYDEALKTLQDIVSKADDDDTDLLARAYDAMGNCYRKQKDTKHALWAYLRVDAVYSSLPEARAEALANLSSLWLELKRPDRSRAARDELVAHYPYSRWTKQAQR
jgi:tetratricopeptide (TPR) repeat protein